MDEAKSIPKELDKITASVGDALNSLGEIRKLVEKQPDAEVAGQVRDQLAKLEAAVNRLPAAVAEQVSPLLAAVEKLSAVAVDQKFIDDMRTFMEAGRVAFETVGRWPDKAESTPTDQG